MLRTVFLGSLLVFAGGFLGLTLFMLPNNAESTVVRGSPVDNAESPNIQNTQLQADNGVVAKNSFTIVNSNFFDGFTFHENMTLVVREGIIEKWGEDLSPPTGFDIIDGQGHTIIPGLIDAHTHSYLDALTVALNFGVTTQIDMFTDVSFFGEARANRDRITDTQKSDLFGAGMIATVKGGHGSQFGVPIETLSSPDQASAWVAKRIAEGSDFIKLAYIPNSSIKLDYIPEADTALPSLDLATATALINAAHEQGVMAVAHIATQKAATEMVEAGIDGLVHIFADEKVSDGFIKLAKERNIFIIPTLSVIASVDGQSRGDDVIADVRVGPYLRQTQKASMASAFGADIQGYDLDMALHNVLALHQAGIAILAGSDAPNPGTSYGVSMHDEMGYLVKAGLTPQEALRAATSLPAERFSIEDRGILSAGKRADFIVIDGNMADNINNSFSIKAIYKNGFEVKRYKANQNDQSVRKLFSNLGDFENDLFAEDKSAANQGVTGSAKERFQWVVTTDGLAGGASSAVLSRMEPGSDGTKGALHVKAEIKPGFLFPWAGAFLSFSQTLTEPRNVEDYETINFRVRGTSGNYSVMMFVAGVNGVPPSQVFSVSEDWKIVSLRLDGFVGLDKKALAGIAIVANQTVGVYDFEIDTIKLK